jgi:hypothetical protein
MTTFKKIWRAMRRQRRGIRAENSFTRQGRIAERPQDSGATRRQPKIHNQKPHELRPIR